MKRSDLILQLVKILDTIPENASSYHIVDMLIYAAEKRGMLPPKYLKELTVEEAIELRLGGTCIYVNEWEEDENE